MARGRAPIDRAELLEARHFDMTTLISVVLITGVGFAAIFSATYAAQMNDRFKLQLAFAGAGFVLMLIMAFLPVRWYMMIAYPLYAISLALLVYVAFAGKLVYGHRSWIAIGTAQFQPSELAKLATMLAVGRYLSKDHDLSRIVPLLITIALIMVPVALIMLEPDPGSAIIFVGLLGVVLLWCGADLFMLAAITAPLIVAVLALFGKTPMVASVMIGGAVLFFAFRRNLVITILAFAMVIGVAFSTNFVLSHMKQYMRDRIPNSIRLAKATTSSRPAWRLAPEASPVKDI
jgi:rod shape determining protein RodA